MILSRRRTRGRRKSRMKDVNNILCEEVSSNRPKKKEEKEPIENQIEVIKEGSCFAAVLGERNRSFKDRIITKKFFVGKGFSEKMIYSSESYLDALRHCPSDHVIIDSDGIKVYPAPQRKVGHGNEYVLMRNRFDKVYASYRDLQEAINNCPPEYHIYDVQRYRVY